MKSIISGFNIRKQTYKVGRPKKSIQVYPLPENFLMSANKELKSSCRKKGFSPNQIQERILTTNRKITKNYKKLIDKIYRSNILEILAATGILEGKLIEEASKNRKLRGALHCVTTNLKK